MSKTGLVLATMAVALVAAASAPLSAIAQQKSAAECRKEWQDHKAQCQAAKVTERAYVDQCRAGNSPACGSAAAGPPAPAPAPGGQKSAAECRKEWQDHKAQCQAAKVTERTYVDQCRAGNSPPCGSAAAEPPPAPPAPPPKGPPGSTGAGQFDTEAAAKAHCPSDVVVWVNTATHVYHFAGTRFYGHTQEGKYMCERDAVGAGNRKAENEKRPGT